MSAFDTVMRACRSYLVAAGLFSLAINLLYLASPLYMLQVYNRVVTSGSQVTLLMLTLILVAAFAALAMLDVLRGRILTRMGVRLDWLLASKVMEASFRQGGKGQALREFDTFRQFVSSGSVNALLDLPWVPVYIVAAFLLHPLIGWFTLGGAVLLLVLAVVNEWLLHSVLRDANAAAASSLSFAEMSLRNAEAVNAMGMSDGVIRRWSRDRNRLIARQVEAANRAGGVGGLIRFVRMAMQSLVLGLGALLAIERLVSAGAMFASTFLLGRALQPIEQIVGSWRGIVSARSAYQRIKALLDEQPADDARTSLPPPKGQLSAEAVSMVIPGTQRFALRNVSFRIEAGESLGIVGPSGAGKSTLLRLLSGAVRPSSGVVRLDGADLKIWPRAALGPHLGYLPQDIELFADTVAANIARFAVNADADVVKAAELAGVHEMILRLPNGYDTAIGEGGATLSGGYRQRIGLARAVFRLPRLVLLDEPSSNLDADGDVALADCAARLRAAGSTVIIVSHRPATLSAVDKVLFLRDGIVDSFGPRDEVMAALTPRRAAPVLQALEVRRG